MPDKNQEWPPAVSKAGNLAPASTIMILPFKVCEAPGSWRWEAPHPGNWLCLQAPGLRVTRLEWTSTAMSATRWPRHGAGTVRVRVHHAWPVKRRATSSATRTMRQRSLMAQRRSRMRRTAPHSSFQAIPSRQLPQPRSGASRHPGACRLQTGCAARHEQP